LKNSGANPRRVAEQIVERHNHPRNLLFADRTPMEVTEDLGARIQSTYVLRMVQEYVAAMESLGAFIRAVRCRADGGILYQHFEAWPKDVNTFFDEVRRARRVSLGTMLALPSLRALKARGPQDFYNRSRRLFPFIRARLSEVATMYSVARRASTFAMG